MLTKCPQACAFSNIEVLDICDMPVIGVTPSATHNLWLITGTKAIIPIRLHSVDIVSYTGVTYVKIAL